MAELQEELLAAETAVWEALVAGDARADRAVLAEDFLGVYPDGFSGREEHVGQLLTGPTFRNYEIGEVRVIELAEGLGLLAYRARYRRPGRDADEVMYVSSLWRREGAEWVNVFSQDTPAGEAVP